jgi:uncharacterized radical SAM superfamily Fe-S cluster-containing enzyme
LEFQTEVAEGCPLDCGLCPEHKQHTCLGIIEVNTDCNLDCPICFADSGHQPDGYSLTLEQVEFMLDRFVAAEGSPEVVQFSGGEPTIHPQILDFIELAGTKGIRVVMLNTNGIRKAAWTSAGRIGEFLDRQRAQPSGLAYAPFHTEQLELRHRDGEAFQRGLERNGPRAVSEFAQAEQIWAERARAVRGR